MVPELGHDIAYKSTLFNYPINNYDFESAR
jgi:hypothetical protein